jgi:hypothetical protein
MLSTKTLVASAEEIQTALDKGNKRRHMGATNMNDVSSRSHTIFSITVESKPGFGEDGRRLSASSTETDASAASCDDAVVVGTLNLVDLAGSEDARSTGASLRVFVLLQRNLLFEIRQLRSVLA